MFWLYFWLILIVESTEKIQDEANNEQKPDKISILFKNNNIFAKIFGYDPRIDIYFNLCTLTNKKLKMTSGTTMAEIYQTDLFPVLFANLIENDILRISQPFTTMENKNGVSLSQLLDFLACGEIWASSYWKFDQDCIPNDIKLTVSFTDELSVDGKQNQKLEVECCVDYDSDAIARVHFIQSQGSCKLTSIRSARSCDDATEVQEMIQKYLDIKQKQNFLLNRKK